MLSKCANPACLARFRYLHQGRIFNVETGTVLSERNGIPIRKIEHFWLCECCAQTFEVVLEDGVATTRALHQEFAEGVPQEKSKRERDVA